MFKHSAIVLAVLLSLPAAGLAELVDPTRPPAGLAPEVREAVAPAEDLQLSLIVFGDERRLARINGRWLAVGDRIGGAKVLQIERSRVVLRESDQVKSLSLGGWDGGGKVYRERQE